jgi:pSer/pThr/pTyr-binding forkhead associated (FHA) protein
MHLHIYKHGQEVDSKSVEKERITIGRAMTCSIVLESRTVSRLHAVLERSLRDEGYVVTDLSSVGGTFLNGQAVEYAVLKPGDELRIGEYTVRIQSGPPTRGDTLWNASADEMESLEPTGRSKSVGPALWAVSAEEMETQEPTGRTRSIGRSPRA